MDIEAVRLFVMAADLLNISAAGRQLGLAPAVSSARLAKLEHDLGADLLHRTTRKVSLSLEGEEFLPFAREILAQEGAARAALGHQNAVPSGMIRFAASSTFSELYIAPILPEFLTRYPEISFDLRLSDTQMPLIDGGYDLALRNYAIEDSSLRARKLAEDRRILCAAPAYLDRAGTPVVPADLVQHSLLVFKNSQVRRLAALTADAAAKDSADTSAKDRVPAAFPPEGAVVPISCDDGAVMRSLTCAGAGIAMHSLWSVHDLLASGALVHVLPDYCIDDQSAVWLVYPKSNVLTAKVRVFIDFLVEKLGRNPPWASPSTI